MPLAAPPAAAAGTAPPRPDLTVIIPTHSRRERLRELLQCLRAQDGPELQVIVLDDASSDGTAAMLRSFPEVEVLRNERPRGFDSLPDAIALAKAELVMQLDDDAYPAAGTLRLVVDHFERRGAALGLVAMPFVEPVSGRTAFTTYLPDPPPGQASCPTRGFLAGAVAMRTAVARELPPSPPGYFMYETEVAALISILAAGWEADHLPAAVVYHLWDGRKAGVGASSAYLAFRNDLVTIRRYYRGWRRSEMLIGRYLTGLVHLLGAGRAGDWSRALREADALLRRLPPASAPDAVLMRVYPCFEGMTLSTLFSRTNGRRLGWFVGLLPIDQTN